MRKIVPNYESGRMPNILDCSSCFSHPEPRGIPLKMSDVLLNFEKEGLGCKLKVTESPLSYIIQQRSLESEIALSIYIPYPVLMKWHELVGIKDQRRNELNYIDPLNCWIPGRWFKLSKENGSRIQGRLRREAGTRSVRHVVCAI